jgi:hypothetical protein
VQKGLEGLEDYYLASATMERVRKGKERVYTRTWNAIAGFLRERLETIDDESSVTSRIGHS